jgi:small subunit ribosomal protein S7
VPRKGHIPKRAVTEDPIYKDKVVTKLINQLMYEGCAYHFFTSL